MDFLRSCMTNVQLLPHDALNYVVYRNVPTSGHEDSNQDKKQADNNDETGLVNSLRKAGRLVAYSPEDGNSLLWVFQVRNRPAIRPDGTQWTLDHEGKLSPVLIVEPSNPTHSDETILARLRFLEALTSLVQDELSLGGQPSGIGVLTWLVSPRQTPLTNAQSPSDGQMGNFIFSVTLRIAASGSLVYLPEIYPTALDLVSQLTESQVPVGGLVDQAVLLAPLGLPATLSSVIKRDEGGTWLSDASKFFENRYKFLPSGDLSDPCNWIIARPHARLLSDAPASGSFDRCGSVIWPACLCIFQESPALLYQSILDAFLPLGVEAPGFEDPLRKAEEWFLAKAERDAAILPASTADISLLESSNHAVEDEFDPVMLFSVTSPLYLRNNDSNHPHGVYPTPPDGVASVVGQASAAAANPVDEPMEEDEPMHNPTNQSEQLPHMGSDDNVEIDDDNEDLFGDMDEDTFANPDVTDADFSFFDESSAGKPGASRRMSPEKVQRPPTRDAALSSASQDFKPSLDRDVNMTRSAADITVKHDASDYKKLSLGPIPSLGIHTDIAPQHQIKSMEPVDRLPSPRSGVATPPLSPVIVKDRLFPGSYFSNIQQTNPENRQFSPVEFKATADMADSKYSLGGKFSSGADDRNVSAVESTSKRSISLRDFLHKDPSNQSMGVGRFARKKVLVNDSDDSDTDSTATMYDDYSRNVRPRMGDDSLSQHKALEDKNAHRILKRQQDLASRLDQTKFVPEIWEHVWGAKSTLLDCCWLYNLVVTRNLAEQARDPRVSLWDLFDFDGQDIIEVAQLVATHSIHGQADVDGMQPFSNFNGLASERDQCFSSIATSSDAKVLSLPHLATMSSGAAASNTNDTAGQNVARPTPKRSATILGASAFGQQLFPLNAPFVRLRRVDVTWDMLSSAVPFWEALGLEPAHGPKDVTADLIMVGSDDFRDNCLLRFHDMQYFYEACKLGQHGLGFKVHRKSSPSNMGSPNDTPVRLLLTALKDAFRDLAAKVNQRARQHPNRSSVVYVFSPFRDPGMTKYVCACYRVFVKELTSESKNVVLHIVPLEEVVCQDDATSAKSQTLIRLALSIYNKVEGDPIKKTRNVWKLSCTPSVTLVSPIPRKINFTMSETPPLNLMQEAQVLHLAYAISLDGRWLTAAFTDYTGVHQSSCSFCLYETEYDAVLTSLRDFTRSLMPPSATWRLIVACAGHTSTSDRQAWTSLAAPHIAITVAEVCLSAPIQIYPRQDLSSSSAPALSSSSNWPQTASSLTPVSTPQATSNLSPDPSQHPPTPTEQSTITLPESDPDAQLVDTRDESYALVLPFSTVRPRRDTSSSPRLLAAGMLLKRGPGTPNTPLPSLGVDIVVVAQPRLVQGQQPWLMPRSAEYVLREVLAWYRGLGLLGRLRGVRGCERGEVPWHVGVVTAAAEGLERFFD